MQTAGTDRKNTYQNRKRKPNKQKTYTHGEPTKIYKRSRTVFLTPVSLLMVCPSHFRLSDAGQPEVRPSPFLYALKLTSPLPVDVLRSKTLLLKLLNTEPLSDLVAITSISSPFTGTRISSLSPSKGNNFEVQ